MRSLGLVRSSALSLGTAQSALVLPVVCPKFAPRRSVGYTLTPSFATFAASTYRSGITTELRSGLSVAQLGEFHPLAGRRRSLHAHVMPVRLDNSRPCLPSGRPCRDQERDQPGRERPAHEQITD